MLSHLQRHPSYQPAASSSSTTIKPPQPHQQGEEAESSKMALSAVNAEPIDPHEPTTTAAAGNTVDFPEADNETAPLLGGAPPDTLETEDAAHEETVRQVEAHLRSRRGVVARKRQRVDNLLAFVVVGSLLTIFVQSLLLVVLTPGWAKNLRFFAAHPPFQSLAVLLFGIGILLPQTASSNDEPLKSHRRYLHQAVQMVGFVVIILGSIAMIYNKAEHESPHFTTWHSWFGLASLVLLIVHVTAGIFSTWFSGALVGGVSKGKSFWKWHRLLGYVLFPLMLVTVHAAGYWSDWVRVPQNTNERQRIWIYTVLPVLVLVGVWTRARWSRVGAVGKLVKKKGSSGIRRR